MQINRVCRAYTHQKREKLINYYKRNSEQSHMSQLYNLI